MSQQGGIANWRKQATITIPEYAAIMKVGRNTAYEAARAGEVPTIKVRGRVLVCVPALIRQLEGADSAHVAKPDGAGEPEGGRSK